MWSCGQRVLEGPAPPVSAAETQRFLTPQGSVFCRLDLNSIINEVRSDHHPPTQKKSTQLRRCTARLYNPLQLPARVWSINSFTYWQARGRLDPAPLPSPSKKPPSSYR